MAINSLSFPMPQAFSGGADFTPLANLGNVYQQAQDRAATQTALSQMGNDMQTNAMTMIKSGQPALVQQGMTLMNQLQTQQRQTAQQAEQQREFQMNYALAKSREQRASEQYEQDTPTYRAQLLKGQNIDPADPTWRTWVLTGQGAPDVNKVAAANKEQQERDARYADAIRRGKSEQDAQNYALTGKLAKEDLSPQEMKLAEAADTKAAGAADTLYNIDKMIELVPKAYSGWAASERAKAAQMLLPWESEGATAEQRLENLGLQNVTTGAKAIFGARPAVAETQMLQKLETLPNQSKETKLEILGDLKRLIQSRQAQAQNESEGIRNRTYFKPGGGQAQTAAPQQAAPSQAAPTAKPSLKDFMDKARAANPGYSDSEIAQEWKRRYGG